MIVAIHQPNYAPWLGYFCKIARADVFVFLDDVQYTKNGYTNRTRILAGGTGRWLTVPVHVRLGDPIRAVVPAQHDWPRRHLDALKARYRSAPAFGAVWGAVQAMYETVPAGDLAAINSHIVRFLAERLGLMCRFADASHYETEGLAGDDRLIRLVRSIDPAGTYLSGRGGARYQDPAKFAAAGLGLAYSDFEHPTYPQISAPFVAGLSALDAVFHCGFVGTAALLGAPTPAGADAVDAHAVR